MNATTLTSPDLKKINRSKVFENIYNNKITSRPTIATDLNLSLPTVNQNLKELEELGLIEKNGLYQSTGGRKAQMISCVHTARIGIGVEVLKSISYIAAIDLYGHSLEESSLMLQFDNTEDCFQKLADWINQFIREIPYPAEHILGVGIGIQGLTSQDGKLATYAEILGATDMSLDSFSRYISLPCILIHDSEAAAFAELWHQKEITDGVYVSLNRNLGGAVILNKHIYHGQEARSGVFEHMCMVPDGKPCYCGKKGCVEAYCSANSLKELIKESGIEEDFNSFFNYLRHGDKIRQDIWTSYLRNLALAISNIHTVLDNDVILGGLVQTYICAEDITVLYSFVQEYYPIPLHNFYIKPGICGERSATIGCALYYIDKFLKGI